MSTSKVNFPKLYSRNSNESIQTWEIIVNGNQYHVLTGQLDGKIVESIPTVCSGKNLGKANETSPSEQALLEAESKFKKKKKTGYFESIDEIDAEIYVQPMLAKSYKDYANKITYPCIVQCKFNGARAIVRKSGIFSRKGEPYLSVPHISEASRSFFDANPTAILDGELFNEAYRQKLNKIMELVRKTVHISDEDFLESKKLIRFYMYDGYNFFGHGPNSPYSIRKFYVDQITEQTEFFEPVQDFVVKTEAELMAVYEALVKEGHEGAIIRFPDSHYQNKRTKDLLKLKPVDSDEFRIIGFTEGTGNWSGTAKTIHLQRIDGKIYDDGTNTVDATFKGTFEDAVYTLKNQSEFIGKTATIYFNGYTGKGKENYAQFDFSQWKNDK